MIYDFDYKVLTQQLTPNIYAFTQNISWINSITYPIHWLKKRAFESIKKGVAANVYNNALTYSVGNTVQYGQSIYECLKPSIGILPTNSEYWVLITQDWVGIDERVLFSNSKLKFEYALNKRFKTVFRNPNSYTTPTNSDIYISNINNQYSFIVGGNINNSSTIFNNTSSQQIYSTANYGTGYSFSINIPIATYNLFGENIIRFYADKINNAGIKYTIITY
jgi:hypothetical protein